MYWLYLFLNEVAYNGPTQNVIILNYGHFDLCMFAVDHLKYDQLNCIWPETKLERYFLLIHILVVLEGLCAGSKAQH